MGKIIVSEFITLDGVIEAPGGDDSLGELSGWSIPFFNQAPALSSVAEGYDTYVVMDACGLFSPSPPIAAISCLSQTSKRRIICPLLVLWSAAGPLAR